MKVYKVVRCSPPYDASHPGLYSLSVNLAWECEYFVGRPTYAPHDSSLMAFESLEYARAFLSGSDAGMEIYLAEAEISDIQPARILYWPYLNEPDRLTNFWTQQANLCKIPIKAKDLSPYLTTFPIGTIFCKSITLLEKISDDDTE